MSNIYRTPVSQYSSFLLFTLHFLIVFTAHSQHVSDYSIRHFTDESGLPQISVKSIAPDSSGFIWLATENGLVRFDGFQFKVFNTSNLQIPSNRVYTIQPNSNSPKTNLYGVLETGYVIRISNGRAYTDSAGSDRSKVLDPVAIHREQGAYMLFEAPHNVIMDRYLVPIGGTSGEYYFFDRNRLDYYAGWVRKTSMAIPPLDMTRIFRIGKSILHLDHNGKVILFDGTKSPVERHLAISGDILKDPKFKESPGKTVIYWNNTTDQAFFTIGARTYALRLKNKDLLVATLILSEFNLQTHLIKAIYYDQSHDRIFLGSSIDGLYEFTKKVFRTLTLRGSAENNVQYAQGARNDSTIMVPKGYDIGLDGSGKQFEKKLKLVSFHKADSWLLAIDHQQNCWVSADSGIVRFTSDRKGIADKWKFGTLPTSIYHAPNGIVWTQTADSILYYIDPSKTNAMPRKIIKLPTRATCYEAIRDTLWIGGRDGIYMLSLKSKKVTRIPGTRHLKVLSIYMSSPAQVWITTAQNGFFLLANKKLVSFPLDRNGFLANSHCIFEDRNHFFWIPTNKGLFQVAKSELLKYSQRKLTQPYYHYYSRENGFNTNEFNGACQPCAVRLGNGYVSLPSLKGLVWFRPEDFKPEMPSGMLVVDAVMADGKLLPVSRDTLKLPFNPDPFEVKIATPFFGKQNNLLISYSLVIDEKHTNKWTSVSRDQTIHLTNLPSGNHNLLIRKHNGFGNDNFSEKRFTIIVAKPWYETTFARTIAIIFLFTCVLGIIRVQNWRLVNKNKLLENAITARTRSLNETMDALQDSEKSLTRQVKTQIRMIASLTHDIRTPLYAAASVASEIERVVDEGQHAMAKEIGNSIADSLTRLSTLLDNTVDYIKAQLTEGNPISETINLHDLVDQKLHLFTINAKQNHCEIFNSIEHQQTVRCNSYMLSIILNNLVDNAIKNTYNGTIRISSRTSEGKMTITVADTGYGIPERLVRWLNDDSDNTSVDGGANNKNLNGVGLMIVKEVSNLLDANVYAERTPVGTSIHLCLNTLL